MKLNHLFGLARIAAQSRSDGRSFLLAAVGMRCDGTVVMSPNGPSERPNKHVHAEARLARKLDKGSTVYVARVRKGDGEFGNARPCRDCQRVLAARGVKRVFYTVSNHEFGVLDL